MRFVTEVKYLFGYTLLLTFDDGAIKVFDAEPELWGELFEPLKDKAFFKQVSIDCGSLHWPNDADFCPDSLYEHSIPVEQAFRKGA